MSEGARAFCWYGSTRRRDTASCLDGRSRVMLTDVRAPGPTGSKAWAVELCVATVDPEVRLWRNLILLPVLARKEPRPAVTCFSCRLQTAPVAVSVSRSDCGKASSGFGECWPREGRTNSFGGPHHFSPEGRVLSRLRAFQPAAFLHLELSHGSEVIGFCYVCFRGYSI